MRYLLFQGSRPVVGGNGLYLAVRPPSGTGTPHGGPLVLEARAGGESVTVLTLEDRAEPPEGMEALPLRAAMPRLSDDELALASRASQLLTWRRDHRFCGRCGRETELVERGSALGCTGCGMEHFPRVSPAVIVLVHDGDRVLLGRAPRFPEGMYSTLAGFVEPGESAEETVHREILEESGVTVRDLRYQGSQSWPFPHSLMLGYHAEWAGGEIRCEDDELEDVRWFPVDRLPRLPSHHSIARRLIESYVEMRRSTRR